MLLMTIVVLVDGAGVLYQRICTASELVDFFAVLFRAAV
jgi:hypothetical protein